VKVTKEFPHRGSGLGLYSYFTLSIFRRVHATKIEFFVIFRQKTISFTGVDKFHKETYHLAPALKLYITPLWS
jgi:hypothetical protein